MLAPTRTIHLPQLTSNSAPPRPAPHGHTPQDSPLGTQSSALRTLTPREAELLSAFLILRYDMIALAEQYKLNPRELLDFANSPAVQQNLAALKSFADQAFALRSLESRTKAIDLLEEVAKNSIDRIEKRRAASAILRGLNPVGGVPRPPKPSNSSRLHLFNRPAWTPVKCAPDDDNPPAHLTPPRPTPHSSSPLQINPPALRTSRGLITTLVPAAQASPSPEHQLCSILNRDRDVPGDQNAQRDERAAVEHGKTHRADEQHEHPGHAPRMLPPQPGAARARPASPELDPARAPAQPHRSPAMWTLTSHANKVPVHRPEMTARPQLRDDPPACQTASVSSHSPGKLHDSS
jgi:hypothetical protein